MQSKCRNTSPLMVQGLGQISFSIIKKIIKLIMPLQSYRLGPQFGDPACHDNILHGSLRTNFEAQIGSRILPPTASQKHSRICCPTTILVFMFGPVSRGTEKGCLRLGVIMSNLPASCSVTIHSNGARQRILVASVKLKFLVIWATPDYVI